MSDVPLASLFLLHVGSNTGYAIAPLESMFYLAGLELAGGDPHLVHFGYRHLNAGHPTPLPREFSNLIAFDFKDESRQNIRCLTNYVKQNRISLVLIFDIQPVGPLFRPLRQAGVRTILTYWGAPISSLMPRWKLAFKKVQVAMSRSKVDGLIFESFAMADLAIHGRGVPPEMIHVVPLGVDTTVFRPAQSDYVYKAFDFPRDRKVVVYSGHMERRKGVHSLVEAAIELLVRRQRSDVCFLICGNTGDQSKEFEQMYAGLGIETLIHFGGYRPDLREIYPSCFCGVIPSVGWDSFPRTAVEMAASGLAVVASRLQGLPEAVLERHTGLLFEPGNAQELADCLETFLSHPELAAELGRRGRKRCEEELNLETQRARFVSVLRKRLACSTQLRGHETLPGSRCTPSGQ